MNGLKMIWFFALGIASAAAAAPAPTEVVPVSGKTLLENVRHILFLGDSITYDGRYVADFTAWLDSQYPDRTYDVINVGLPSETVSGLSEPGHANGQFVRPVLRERLERVLAATKPDLVIACYGMNCGIYMPFDADRFQKYKDGIIELHDAVSRRGARIVHVTPPMYDHLTGKGAAADYNDVLGKYGEWVLSRSKDGWSVIDLHGPMNDEVSKRRAAQKDFSFQPDGIHPNDAGHWFMAQQLIRYFGDEKSASAASPQAMLGGRPGGEAILKPESDRMAVLRDAWLTETKHTHPQIPKGLPLDQAQAKAAELTKTIRGLISGK